jgi:hypothetical protein
MDKIVSWHEDRISVEKWGLRWVSSDSPSGMAWRRSQVQSLSGPPIHKAPSGNRRGFLLPPGFFDGVDGLDESQAHFAVAADVRVDAVRGLA